MPTAAFLHINNLRTRAWPRYRVLGFEEAHVGPPIMLQTALAATFLRALLRWAQRHSRGGPIALPSGRVEGDELHRVVVAVVCAT